MIYFQKVLIIRKRQDDKSIEKLERNVKQLKNQLLGKILHLFL